MRTRQLDIAEARHRQHRSSTASTCATVALLSSVPGSTIVTLDLPGGSRREVAVASSPDPDLARRLTAGFRRLVWVRIDLTGPAPRCVVSGTVRRPCTQRLPLAAALALSEAGIPAVVRLPAEKG